MSSGRATILLRTTTNAVGQPIVYPQGEAEVTALLIEMAPGETTPWHHHPVPLLGYIFEGALTVYQADGGKRVVQAGEVSHEAVGPVHRGCNEGSVLLKMVVFVVGVKGMDFTLFDEPPV